MSGLAQVSILLNNTPVEVKDDLFIEAYQEGYLLSDIGIYHFIAQNVYLLERQDVENAGYITGWFAALFETTTRPRVEGIASPVSQ